MDRVLFCAGSYATIPYYFENLGLRVYSAEELCYVLKENAFLLDKELLDRKLVRWIEDSLELRDLAAMLYPLLHRKDTVAAFVDTILRYVQFYGEDEILGTAEILKVGANLNTYEKLKSRVDHMVENGRYALALSEYDALLEQIPEGEKQLTSNLLHNKGVALCGLFLFEEAASCFLQAQELFPDRENMIAYLSAKRMSMEEPDYIAFAAEYPESYEEMLEVEKRVEGLRESYALSEQKQRLDEHMDKKSRGDMAAYYEEIGDRVQELKNQYRANVNG